MKFYVPYATGKRRLFGMCFGHAQLQVMCGQRDGALQKSSCEDGEFFQLWDKLQQCLNQKKTRRNICDLSRYLD